MIKESCSYRYVNSLASIGAITNHLQLIDLRLRMITLTNHVPNVYSQISFTSHYYN